MWFQFSSVSLLYTRLNSAHVIFFNAFYSLTDVQDSGNGLLETTLCFELADLRTFRTYYVIADNTLGRRAEAVELNAGCCTIIATNWDWPVWSQVSIQPVGTTVRTFFDATDAR